MSSTACSCVGELHESEIEGGVVYEVLVKDPFCHWHGDGSE